MRVLTKGRIDISVVKITDKMRADRNDPRARVERDKKTGKPYDLKSDDSRRWVCDGTRLFDIDDERKEARITNLPPNVRGANIMNSPLPFLFGLPPQEALRRFTMKILEVNATASPSYVQLSVLPRLGQDARNWKAAQVFLNTETYLPLAVKTARSCRN